ncbi:hypothetical protein [Sagittula salina]|uniref:Uncharacterized protein n=1 Tax=Sagittula salina TaxID=2820268 RepID=A0A940MN72_9RHOB|nr:hypothetical protein [Sagittula salina]MBP0481741.1 hypothetical protein [Sagittula salina]
MTIHRSYLVHPPLALFRYEGRVDMAMLLEAFGAHRVDPAHVPGSDVFADLTDLTEAALDFEVLRHLLTDAAMHYRTPCETRLVFVAPTDLGYGVARMYQSMSAGLSAHERVEVLRDRTTALAALGLQPDLALWMARATPGRRQG